MDIFGYPLDTAQFNAPLAKAMGGFRVFIYLAILGGIAYGIYYLLFSYKHRIIIREQRGNSEYVHFDRIRVRKKGNDITWHLLKAREQIPIPPDDCISLGKKGVKIVTASRTETGEMIFLKTRMNDPIKPFEPITTNQRIMYREIYKKINAKRMSDWKLLLPQVASLATMGIVIVLLMVFWGDMAQPLLSMAGEMNKFKGEDTKQMEILERIENGVQSFKPVIKPEVKPPPD